MQPLPQEHPLLLLAYLSAQDAWIPRSEIVALLFEDDDESVARNKLRQLLFRAKKQVWFEGLEANPQHLKHNARTDLRAFRTAIEAGDWETAVSEYSGALLQNTPVATLANYESWLDDERADLSSSYLEAAMWQAETLMQESKFEAAFTLLRNLLVNDPLNEEAMQAYLAAANKTDKKAEALKSYERFKAQLAHDLNMNPLAETLAQANALIEALNQEKLQTLSQVKTEEPAPPELVNAPKGLSPFVGRDPELAHLIGLLEHEETQLLSLLGIGGIGKTRLALAVASDFAKRQEHGGVFVPLASVTSHSYIADTIIKALGLEPDSKLESKTQLFSHLKDKVMLMLLDNFEHLIEATELIQELMAEAPNVKLLITSRERLNFSQEQIFELAGLALPETFDETLPLEAYDGINLFLRSARKNKASFTFSGENRKDIFDLCQTLEGVPLALELAASWLRLMDVSEVLAETRKSFDLIESDFADLPSRHQSLRAVFDSSWKLLTSDEQTTLVALSIFAGGFTLDAARAVTGGSPRTLLKLVNKSLIRREQTGRFEFLEVVRQYAYEKLLADPQQVVEIKTKHADFFAALAETAETPLKGGPEQLNWLNQLEPDHANLRKALEYFLENYDQESALELANNLFQYWFIRGHWNEVEQFAERILELNPSNDNRPTLAKLLAHLAYVKTLQGYYQIAWASLNKALDSFKDSNDTQGLAQTLCYMGINSNYQNEYEKAKDYLFQSLTLLETSKEPLAKASVLHEIGNIYLRQEHLLKAKQFYENALELRQQAKDTRGSARTLSNLGIVARRQGNYTEAEKRYDQGLVLSREIDDRLGVADSLNALGVLAKAQGRYSEARKAYEESLDLYQRCGDSLGEAVILENFGILARLEKNFVASKRFFESCLANHQKREDKWGMAKALNGLGLASFHLNELEHALNFLKQGQIHAQKLANQQILTQNLLAFAYVLSFSSHQELAVQLLALACQTLEHLGMVLAPIEQSQIKETEKRLRDGLAKQTFAELWQAGQTLTNDAIAKIVAGVESVKVLDHQSTL